MHPVEQCQEGRGIESAAQRHAHRHVAAQVRPDGVRTTREQRFFPLPRIRMDSLLLDFSRERPIPARRSDSPVADVRPRPSRELGDAGEEGVVAVLVEVAREIVI